MYREAVEEFRRAFGVSLAATSSGRVHLCGRGEAVWLARRGQPPEEDNLLLVFGCCDGQTTALKNNICYYFLSGFNANSVEFLTRCLKMYVCM